MLFLISALVLEIHFNYATALPPRRVNLYKWLAHNSYICDPTLLNKRSYRFLVPRESLRSRCSCGDPLLTKSACGKRFGTRNKTQCFRIPESCLQEYNVIFENGGNRLPRPLSRNHSMASKKPISFPNRKPSVAKRLLVKKRLLRVQKIVSTIPVTTVLQVRKLKRLSG
ncbi:hypothetical protein L3Y34_016802 [Caenorhabditis briggsae]|nr:hypothetical protein L3Y34_016802 [Caenorhabditis briggsae]